MRLVEPPRQRRDPSTVIRVVIFIRTDISGVNAGRHHDAITKLCADRGYEVVEHLEGDAGRWRVPTMRVLTACRQGNADAVITPSADHLGDGLRAISYSALVHTLEPEEMWDRGQRVSAS
ncbi:hypothetical protein [Nocardia sp. NPDC057455]|uniref:hypothetical protein n=1 Tax=Nocardia sp. NPDC057455 TaxID=3346138 RepID=UPI00366A942E